MMKQKFLLYINIPVMVATSVNIKTSIKDVNKNVKNLYEFVYV